MQIIRWRFRMFLSEIFRRFEAMADGNIMAEFNRGLIVLICLNGFYTTLLNYTFVKNKWDVIRRPPVLWDLWINGFFF